jgi:ABC-type branched-subunit amino acid transport system substrate-binding protein
VPATQKSLPGETATIGAILPLHGPQQAEGETLLAALQVALEQEQARGPLPDGRKLILVARDESGPWGQASTEILKLVEQDHALVVLTSANGNIAHQAEQIANKLSFPILTFASDPTTTQTNVPWLFRLGPSDADQARVFGRRIYSELRLRKVLLVVQTDHDGRVGRAEFEKAARELKGPAPDVWELPPSPHNFESLAEVLRAKAPQAVVVWTDGTGREQLLAVIRKTTPLMPVFLSTKTAQLGTQGLGAGLCITAVMEDQKLGDSFAVVSLSGRVDPMRRDFEQAYRARTGALLGIAAFEAYEAVRLTAEGLRAAGANRILLRDYFANGGRFHGRPSIVPFDPAGNNVEEFTIVTIDAQAARVALP